MSAILNVETTYEDYTGMSEGEKVEGGVIRECPRCRRLGRFTHKYGRNVYEHRRTSPDETRETCVI